MDFLRGQWPKLISRLTVQTGPYNQLRAYNFLVKMLKHTNTNTVQNMNLKYMIINNSLRFPLSLQYWISIPNFIFINRSTLSLKSEHTRKCFDDNIFQFMLPVQAQSLKDSIISTMNLTVSFIYASVWMKAVYATHLPILLKHFSGCVNDICCHTFLLNCSSTEIHIDVSYSCERSRTKLSHDNALFSPYQHPHITWTLHSTPLGDSISLNKYL
jgi:hypothetical protein